jgi:hypothetical protein
MQELKAPRRYVKSIFTLCQTMFIDHPFRIRFCFRYHENHERTQHYLISNGLFVDNDISKPPQTPTVIICTPTELTSCCQTEPDLLSDVDKHSFIYTPGWLFASINNFHDDVPFASVQDFEIRSYNCKHYFHSIYISIHFQIK